MKDFVLWQWEDCEQWRHGRLSPPPPSCSPSCPPSIPFPLNSFCNPCNLPARLLHVKLHQNHSIVAVTKRRASDRDGEKILHSKKQVTEVESSVHGFRSCRRFPTEPRRTSFLRLLKHCLHYNIAGGLFFQDLGFREGLFSQELSDFESSISGFFDLIRVSSSGCWPQGSGDGIEVWFKFVAAAFYLYDGQFLAQKERERIWHWQQQGGETWNAC